MPSSDNKRREKTYSLMRQLDAHKITLPQFRAQMKDLAYEEWEIDLYLDGDPLLTTKEG